MSADPSEGRERARPDFDTLAGQLQETLGDHHTLTREFREIKEALESAYDLGRRSLEQERGFVTPDGSASTHPRDREWADALNAAGGIQIESFKPITVINIAAVHKGDS